VRTECEILKEKCVLHTGTREFWEIDFRVVYVDSFSTYIVKWLSSY